MSKATYYTHHLPLYIIYIELIVNTNTRIRIARTCHSVVPPSCLKLTLCSPSWPSTKVISSRTGQALLCLLTAANSSISSMFGPPLQSLDVLISEHTLFLNRLLFPRCLEAFLKIPL
jgi:hypothetical protein